MTFQHRARVVAGLAAVASLALAGCGGSPTGADVTVTVTPTVTAKAAPAKKTPAATATSDVKGRAFDYGTVTKVGTVAGTTVIELDRWTWKGLDDAKLAQQGVPTAPFKGAVPYENQNAKLTYSIPVADGARILVHHCVAADQPLQTKSADAAALAKLPDRENTVLVKLDDQGRMVAADNIPGCPG
ncbi:hypothetical protein GCM10027517_10900 [Phycicoccus ginsengisoli]